jgi:hypothetical protein
MSQISKNTNPPEIQDVALLCMCVKRFICKKVKGELNGAHLCLFEETSSLLKPAEPDNRRLQQIQEMFRMCCIVHCLGSLCSFVYLYALYLLCLLVVVVLLIIIVVYGPLEMLH